MHNYRKHFGFGGYNPLPRRIIYGDKLSKDKMECECGWTGDRAKMTNSGGGVQGITFYRCPTCGIQEINHGIVHVKKNNG